MKRSEIFERLKILIVEKFSVQEEDVLMSSKFSDFDADSLDIVDLVMGIESDFDIHIPDELVEKITSVEEAIYYIQEALVELSKNKTTLVIAHRLSTIESADKIVVLDHGKIVEVGDHASLIEKGTYYAELHRNQFKDDPQEITKTDEIIDLTVPEETEINQVSFIEESWYKKRLWLWILWPISRLIKSIAIRRRNKFLLN